MPNIVLANNISCIQKDKRYQARKVEEMFSSPEEPGWENLCLNCIDLSCNGRKFPEFKDGNWFCDNYGKLGD